MKRFFCAAVVWVCVVPALAEGITRPEMKATSSRPASRCDLMIKAIELTEDCRLKVTIVNRGPGDLPEAAYDRGHGVGVQASVNNRGWGGYRLFMIDPEKQLQKAGGEVSFDGFKGELAAGLTQDVKAVIVDPRRTANESNVNNNSLARRLTCGAAGQGKAPKARNAVKTRPPSRLNSDR